MNVWGAIRSGKRFRRPGGHWLEFKRIIAINIHGECTFIPDDMNKDDWEIEEPKIEITKEKFWEAARRCMGIPEDKHGVFRCSNDMQKGAVESIHLLADRLGL